MHMSNLGCIPPQHALCKREAACMFASKPRTASSMWNSRTRKQHPTSLLDVNVIPTTASSEPMPHLSCLSTLHVPGCAMQTRVHVECSFGFAVRSRYVARITIAPRSSSWPISPSALIGFIAQKLVWDAESLVGRGGGRDAAPKIRDRHARRMGNA
jgi:hypothetical protein